MITNAKFIKRTTKVFVRSFLWANASIGLAVSASAADLDGIFKAPPPAPNLTWNGITIIGAIDVSGQYESTGAPIQGAFYSPAAQILPYSRVPTWVFGSNQSIQSFVGLKVDEALTNDIHFISRLEVGINPTTGTLPDAMKLAVKMNGIPLNQQVLNGDGSRAGQFLNGEAWAGFDANKWGAIHVGRNSSVSSDMGAAYDPLFSYGFSLNAWVGYLGGQGASEDAKIDSSVKYLNSFGPFRTEILYGAPGTNVNSFFQGTVGYVRPEFSVDFLGGYAKDEVAISALSGTANLGSQYLGARVFNTEMVGVFAKYVFDVGGNGYQDQTKKFTLSGGYNRLDWSNPTDGGLAPGHLTIGDYQLGPTYSTNGLTGAGIVNYAFTGGDRLMNLFFIAGKYQYDQQWSVAMGYENYTQNSFGFGVNSLPGIVSPSYSNTSCSSSAFFNCRGMEQTVSFRVDYDWTKNVKIYGGMTYSKVSGGMAFGFLESDDWAPTVGVRGTF